MSTQTALALIALLLFLRAFWSFYQQYSKMRLRRNLKSIARD